MSEEARLIQGVLKLGYVRIHKLLYRAAFGYKHIPCEWQQSQRESKRELMHTIAV